jgi:hypothetical protein
VWVSPHYTFVPEALFEPAKAETYLSFNHGAMQGVPACYRHIGEAGVYDIFSCPDEWTSLIRFYQPDVRLFHHPAPLLHALIGKTPLTGRILVAVYFYSRNLDITVVKDNRLLFYNSFQINAPADTVYYLAAVCNMLDIDLSQSSAKLVYVGSPRQTPPEMAILNRHVSMPEYEPAGASFVYSHYITEPFRREFTNLFHLYECES